VWSRFYLQFAAMKKDSTTAEGRFGEAMAAGHLVEKGLVELHRNWRAGKLEIDLIMKDAEVVVFVEVKLRFGEWAEDPDLAVTKGKIKRIISAACVWTEDYDWLGEIRFDIVSIRKPQQKYIVEHIPDAFGPGPEGFF